MEDIPAPGVPNVLGCARYSRVLAKLEFPCSLSEDSAVTRSISVSTLIQRDPKFRSSQPRRSIQELADSLIPSSARLDPIPSVPWFLDRLQKIVKSTLDPQRPLGRLLCHRAS